MRPTLHEYLIEQFNKHLKMSETVAMKFRRCYDYAELTNRKPKIEDFIGDNLIFKGEWRVVENIGYHGVDFQILAFEFGAVASRYKNTGEVEWGDWNWKYARIEELPREIEFKDEI